MPRHTPPKHTSVVGCIYRCRPRCSHCYLRAVLLIIRLAHISGGGFLHSTSMMLLTLPAFPPVLITLKVNLPPDVPHRFHHDARQGQASWDILLSTVCCGGPHERDTP